MMAMTIGRRIRKRREQLGLSQDDLAIMMGYSGRSAISAVENDKRDISWENVCKYAKALKCSPSYLMKWEDPIPEDDLEILEEVYADPVLRKKLMDYALKLKEIVDAETT
jgi:transcriptional regulator with XRE-family HTH domain